MKLVVCLVALCLIAWVILYALRCKGDVKAAFRMPFVEFSLETKDRSPEARSGGPLPARPGRSPDLPAELPNAQNLSKRAALKKGN